jgi:hypothetical protein
VQAASFSTRKGQIWDTWAYFHEGRYYLHYLAGHFNRWDGHELALSDDGVHWKEQGVMIKPREGVKWMGTGHIWKSPEFGRNHTWVMNYSEWFGDKQDIMFATSSNLVGFVALRLWFSGSGWHVTGSASPPYVIAYLAATPKKR